MIEFLNDIDAQAFGAINMCHGAYADNFMWLVSNRLAWGLMGLTFVLLLARKGWRCALLTLAAVALAVLVADQVSSSLIKHAVERLRPSHDPSLADTVHIVRQYRGGLYGFVSSHAANSVAVGLLLGLIIPADYHAEGISFFTDGSSSQQLGYMNRPEGYNIPPHTHNVILREVSLTQEVLIIRSGRVRVDFYTREQRYLGSSIASAGDIVFLGDGGHGFKMLEDSEIVEVKQGPYCGERDKIRFTPIDDAQVKMIEK